MDAQKWMVARHYDKAPIKEAIIDIRIDRPNSLALSDLESLDVGYPERRNLFQGQLLGQLTAGQLTATTRQDQTGYQFIGSEGRHVVQVRLDGFTFSRLAPYQTWEQLRDEAKTTWKFYRRAVGSAAITRVGVRYVNQLDLPLPVRDLRDFIRSYPEISSDLPQSLGGFFMQIQVPQADIEAMLILNEALLPPPGPGVVSVLLDIDVFREGLSLALDEEVWNTLEVLRVRKNVIFEACITNTTRELIS